MFENLVEMFGMVNNAVVVVNVEGKIIFANDKAKKLLNFDGGDSVLITDVFKDSKLIEIMEHNYVEKDTMININGRMCLTTRTPIHDGNRVIGAMGFFEDMTHLKILSDQLEAERNTSQILKLVLELAYDGIVVVNREGIITMMSDAYKKFLGINALDEPVGKHITHVIPNTRMHIVAETEKSEINQFQEINGSYMIATRVPYYIDGRLSGAIGKVVFRNVSEIKGISESFDELNSQIDHLRSEVKKHHRAKYTLKSIVTQNRRLGDLKFETKKIALGRSNVLILGESGTGKELFAQAIHNESERRHMPFVSVNCAAIPDNLLEAELFGYESGAFTGANREGKVGKFEIADKGTIFLDEIAEMPKKMQAKILRVLQENEVERIGSNRPTQIDVRVIAATNKDIDEMIRNKTFREDLYYRLNVFQLNLPPLKDRKDDIMLIAEQLIDQLNYKYQKNIQNFSVQARSILLQYDWPGNVRELKNVIERAYNIIEGEYTIQSWHLPVRIRTKEQVDATVNEPLKTLMAQAEKKVIMDRLIYYDGNKTRAAKDLGISRVALHKKLSKYELV